MLNILGLVVIIVATYFAYKTARDNGRSGPLWALAMLGAGLGLQIVLPIVIGTVVFVYYTLQGVPLNEIDEHFGGYDIAISGMMIFGSFAGMFLILRYLSNLAGIESSETAPPAPPTFDSEQ
jgi:hypothetical protein